MFNSLALYESLPVTIPQIQRLAMTLRNRLYAMDPQRSTLPAWGERTRSEGPRESKVFSDRRGAGAMLAANLAALAERPDVTVVGIPQGGVIVAAELAKQLEVPLTVWVAKKLRAGIGISKALGAVAEDGEVVIDEDLFTAARVRPGHLVEEVRACRTEIKRRATLYHAASLPSQLAERTIVLVDDGAMSGHTLRAALMGLKKQLPRRIVLALPVASKSVLKQIGAEVDEVLALESADEVTEIGQFYVRFPAVADNDVARLLHKHRAVTMRSGWQPYVRTV